MPYLLCVVLRKVYNPIYTNHLLHPWTWCCNEEIFSVVLILCKVRRFRPLFPVYLVVWSYKPWTPDAEFPGTDYRDSERQIEKNHRYPGHGLFLLVSSSSTLPCTYTHPPSREKSGWCESQTRSFRDQAASQQARLKGIPAEYVDQAEFLLRLSPPSTLALRSETLYRTDLVSAKEVPNSSLKMPDQRRG